MGGAWILFIMGRGMVKSLGVSKRTGSELWFLGVGRHCMAAAASPERCSFSPDASVMGTFAVLLCASSRAYDSVNLTWPSGSSEIIRGPRLCF